jgi:putative flavoprotein involved in K+ transport
VRVDERVVIVGAGPCGLALSRQLRHQRGIDALVLDRADAPAWSWRRRYDGFRLNTCGYWSHLPGQHLPRGSGRWPTRDDMVSYFQDYASQQGLRLRLGTEVDRLDRGSRDWQLGIGGETLTAASVVVATGNYHTPRWPSWPGAAAFTGELLHAADYSRAGAYAGRDVLVVGCGNSATDIAVQLGDGVARRVRMSVRTPPHLVPRAVAGVPVDAFSSLFTHLPVPVLDHAAALMRRVWLGDLSAKGLPLPRQGIYSALRDAGRIPTLGDRLVPMVEDGRVDVVAAVESFTADSVVLADGTSIRPEVVIAATGYDHGLESMVGHLDVLDDDGGPRANGIPSAAPGLWFSGYEEPLIGPLRSFRRQSAGLARDVASYLADVE